MAKRRLAMALLLRLPSKVPSEIDLSQKPRTSFVRGFSFPRLWFSRDFNTQPPKTGLKNNLTAEAG
jgi:hypothetical protein